MKIVVNGIAEHWEGAAPSVLQLLEKHGEPVAHVVVELNGRYLHKQEYGTTQIREGDNLEIILPAFGG